MQYGYGGAALAIVSVVLLVLTIWALNKSPGASEVTCCHGHFHHGVASGEPRFSGIVLWTRLTPNDESREALPVHWQVWEHGGAAAHLSEPIVKGESSADRDHDFTVKVDVQSTLLKPQVKYAFQFSAGSEVSPIGYFRLPPKPGAILESLRYAVFSCSNWRWGYFNAYGAAARESLDFWLHVGDYIYEHGRDTYPNDSAEVIKERHDKLNPKHETVTLDDYRKRHALYRTDPDLQRLSAAAPLVAIWDDHEVANDAWKGGAQGHSKKDGDYAARREAGLRAYHEWMPTRVYAESSADKSDESEKPLWRRFDFGDLASLLVLETRHTARTEPASMTRGTVSNRILELINSAGNPAPDLWPGSKLDTELQALQKEVEANMGKEDKTILGQEQLAWIRDQVQGSELSGTRWRLVAQPLVVQEKNAPNYEKAIQKAGISSNEWSRVLSEALHSDDSKRREAALVSLAAGRYKINLSFDDWMGHAADRARLISSLHQSGPSSTLVYGGDTHNAWAGPLRDTAGKIVAVEFDGMSVTSPGVEFYEPRFPPALEAAAWRAQNSDLVWADTHNRGFMLVNLNKDKQHIEYRSVETKRKGRDASKCLSAFDVVRGGGPSFGKCNEDKTADSFVQANATIASAGRTHRARALGLRRGLLTLSPSN